MVFVDRGEIQKKIASFCGILFLSPFPLVTPSVHPPGYLTVCLIDYLIDRGHYIHKRRLKKNHGTLIVNDTHPHNATIDSAIGSKIKYNLFFKSTQEIYFFVLKENL